MVGGPARDFGPMVAFLSGDGRKKWARFRSRDSTCLPAIISIMQPSLSSTFLGVCFLRGATLHKRQAEQSGLGADLLVVVSMWPWSPGARRCAAFGWLANNHVPCELLRQRLDAGIKLCMNQSILDDRRGPPICRE